MKITILGCGTSTGVPVIGCKCGICASRNSKNKRTRSSIFTNDANSSWKPELETFLLSAPFELFGLLIQPINIYHGKMQILGFRIGKFAYITDCSQIPADSKEMLDNLDVLILGALRHKPHPTHFSIEEAVKAGAELKSKRVILTHLSHNLDYIETNKSLPKGFELAYDGMEIVL